MSDHKPYCETFCLGEATELLSQSVRTPNLHVESCRFFLTLARTCWGWLDATSQVGFVRCTPRFFFLKLEIGFLL